MKNSWFFLLAVFTLINCSLSQTGIAVNKNGNIFSKLYLKGGVEFTSFSNTKPQLSKMEYFSFLGSITYDYSKKLQIEFMYKYLGDIEYFFVSNTINNYPNFYNSSKLENYYSNNFYFKANYFLNKDKDENPIYLTGSLVMDLEKVINTEFSSSVVFDSTGHNYNINNQQTVFANYFRILLGPSIGFGLYLDFGRINFQTEFSFTAKFVPFVNRGFKEYVFGLSVAPVVKL